MLGRLRLRWPADRERGSVTVFTAVFAIAVVFLLALILDGGMAMNARQRAADIAGQAARAAADDIDIGVLRTTGRAVIGAGACDAAQSLAAGYAGLAEQQSVNRVLHVTAACDAPPGSTQAVVTVTVTTQPLVPGVLGGFTVTAQQIATVECGIAQREAC